MDDNKLQAILSLLQEANKTLVRALRLIEFEVGEEHKERIKKLKLPSTVAKKEAK